MKQLLILAGLCAATFVAAPETAKADHLYGGPGVYGGGYGAYGPGYHNHRNCGPFNGYHTPRLNGGYYGGLPYGSLNPYRLNYYNAYGPGLYPQSGVQLYTPGLYFGYYR